MLNVMQNVVTEWVFTSVKEHADPFNEIRVQALVTSPDGKERIVPGFWAGGQTWKIRYSSAQIGIHRYRTACTDQGDRNLHGQEGTIAIVPYAGDNPLYRHGSPRAASGRQYLEHADGKPFFWLGDTWWMALTNRLKWPADVKWLAQDRVDKGFTVIQVVMGLYPDMGPFDPRGANEGGQAWEPGFARINPAFFDAADPKIEWMVESGLLPCLVACWGYYLDFAGQDVIRKQWEYLIARYGAYPVAWCLAGEADMPYYQSDSFKNPELKKSYQARLRQEWTAIAAYVRETDPYGRLLTIHPTEYGRNMVEDASILDLDMLQTGHGGYHSLEPTVKMVRDSVAREPRMPVINSEVNYEGIGGSSLQDVQRYVFWSCMLNGACGHTYGANGIWQVNSEELPYGASPTGVAWGHTSWKDAARLPGSGQVGLGKKLLSRYEWWSFQPHPEWLPAELAEAPVFARPHASGIPGQIRVIYAPFHLAGGLEVQAIEADVPYRVFFFDPSTGEEHDMGRVVPSEEGKWRCSQTRVFQDWVIVLERRCGD
ncbi:DUF4038 domain-containing protein [Paenibacillus rhizovicinus]|uniref:DUF4038 domain-containing protein n=1 Tax=Paenibacillus rhizovicinus TaxID=2704463 RepID=A0A6C0P5G8_9BACL|nr:DUF4038 domain-containing protein [Paenibacillus rhizovicinus]QHW33768.1 DUF4038 domain-containing protein [Paenibacillus rhizovicinus]